jgi:photosystem II stability/assembly factor-like uncharacterized protein
MKRFLFLLAATALFVGQSHADVVSDWNATAVSIGAPLFDLPYMHIAIYDAVNAIDGRYTHFAVVPSNAASWASKEAATAAAARGVLVAFYPTRLAFIDSVYAARIALLPNDSTRTRGIAIGQEVAQGFLALRTDDGRGASIPYTFLPPGPGVYQLTPGAPAPPATPLIPWLARLRPFAMTAVSQFRALVPPALTSATYTQDFNEVKNFGSRDSSLSTLQQRETGRFYSENAGIQYARAIRDFAATRGLTLADNARLFAQLYVAMTDGLIAGWDTKFYYNFWRPVTAIRNADIDGNPLTERDTSWLPLVTTPNHQEYISTHSALTGAMATTLEKFFGTRTIAITFTSTVTGTSHLFTHLDSMEAEMVNARVWGGMHFRTSNLRGIAMGRQVGQWVSRRHFLLRTATPWAVQNSGFTPPSPWYDVRFAAINDNVCWGIHFRSSNRFTRTTDGGKLWTAAPIGIAPPGWRASMISPIDANIACVLMLDPTGATGGGVFKTTDGGTSWAQQTLPPTGASLRIMHFFDTNVGVVVGETLTGGNWVILRTIDGGANWSQVPSSNIPPPIAGETTFPFKASSGNSFWFSGGDGNFSFWRLYRSTDRGITWTVRNLDGGTRFPAFSSPDSGMAAGWVPEPRLRRTTDGGDTWTSESISLCFTPGFFGAVPGSTKKFVMTNGFRPGFGSTPGTAYTTDFGTTWAYVDCAVSRGIPSFANQYTGWSSGDDGAVYAWTGNSLVTSVRQTNEIAQNFRLEQNYPNPFNPSTNIKWQIADGRFVTLKVYDILGRELRTLVNENLQAGSYEVTFDATGLASGVYLYRLQAGDPSTSLRTWFVQTKKLLLLR